MVCCNAGELLRLVGRMEDWIINLLRRENCCVTHTVSGGGTGPFVPMYLNQRILAWLLLG